MTVTPLHLHTEPYGSTGNIGENFLRLLGAPSLNPLQTVIREAVQNIADAAKLGGGPEILIRVRQLDESERSVLQRSILTELPEEEASRAGLQRFLSSDTPVVLEICDFGTTGLGGPTRADRIPVGTDRTDFINFLRNIGTPRDTEHGGGTYGFGKAALYAVSRCRTILVDTLVAKDEERRLIACHIGARHETEEGGFRRQFTGRHWWGVRDAFDGVADPATGDLAADLARAVGLPERGNDRPGTSIMILDLEVEGDDLSTVGQRIIEGLLWSFWPRMMRDAPAAKKFSCRVKVNEEELPIPSPEDFPPLDLFCKAMQAARTGNGTDVRPIACQRPIRKLGNLAIEKGLHSPRRPLVDAESLFFETAHHIALMRPVELVVKYLKGTPLPDERFEWAGVFLVDADHDVERAFAFAEPPAHDDWIPDTLEKGHARTFVNVALRDLEIIATQMGELGSARPEPVSDAPPLARVAGRLGAALAGVTGDGAGTRRGQPGGGGAGGRRAKVSRPVFSRLSRTDGITVAVFTSDVTQDSARSGRIISARAALALDGSAAAKLDAAIPMPEVLHIRAGDGSMASDSGLLDIAGADGRFEIFVSVPGDCAVTVDAELGAGSAA